VVSEPSGSTETVPYHALAQRPPDTSGWKRRVPRPDEADWGVPYGEQGALFPGLTDGIWNTERNQVNATVDYLLNKRGLEEKEYTDLREEPLLWDSDGGPPMTGPSSRIGVVDRYAAEAAGWRAYQEIEPPTHALVEESRRIMASTHHHRRAPVKASVCACASTRWPFVPWSQHVRPVWWT
jgi:hypothetical protein